MNILVNIKWFKIWVTRTPENGDRKSIWRNNILKVFKFDGKHPLTDLRCSTNPKQYKETRSRIHHNQITETKRWREISYIQVEKKVGTLSTEEQTVTTDIWNYKIMKIIKWLFKVDGGVSCQPRLLYPQKISFISGDEILFHTN